MPKMKKGVVGSRFEGVVRVEGLAGPATRRTWLGRPLGERVEWAFLEAGIPFVGDKQPAEDLGRFLVRADVVVTKDALLAFSELTDGEDIRFVSSGRLGNFISDLAFGDDDPWLVFLAPGGPVTAERMATARPVVLDPKERLIEFQLSEAHHGASAVELPISDRLVMPTWHWSQLLWANLLGLGPFLWRGLIGKNIIEVAVKASAAAVRAGSFRAHRIGAKLGRKGKGCRIHPSAVVEGCWLGDDVQIGANAVVRGCILGNGAAVEDLAMVEFSVLDAGARVQRQAMVKFSTLGVGSAVGGLMQLSVLDQHAALKRTGVLMDVSFGQGVSVMANGQRFPAPLAMLGYCIGERSTVGAGVAIAAGRCIPPNLQVVCGPASMVTRIPENLEGLVVVSEGSLAPL